MTPDAPAPDVTVVVPHYRDFARLDRCLTALAAQTFAGTREIIVADNASPEGLAEVERVVAGRARVVVQPERGAGPARNAGVAAAHGRVLAFTDSDCVPEPGWLAAGVSAIAPGMIAGGRMTVLTGARRSAAEAFETVFAFDNEAYVKTKGFTVTANLFVTAEDFARVGPFRTGVSEDVEWCWRAQAAGIVLVYVPDAVAGHPARRDWRELETKWRRLVDETVALDREQGKSAGWIAGRAALMLASTPLGIAKVLASKALSRPGERVGAAAMLVRVRAFRFARLLGQALKA